MEKNDVKKMMEKKEEGRNENGIKRGKRWKKRKMRWWWLCGGDVDELVVVVMLMSC